jgi:Etoposide-induced protein 2.4 (EI24)
MPNVNLNPMNLSPINSMAKAIASQFRPSMLALLVLPWLVSTVLWGVILVLAWGPVTTVFGNVIFGDGTGWMYSILKKWGLGDTKTYVSAALTAFLFVPLMFITAMLVVTVFAMPAVIRHLSANGYNDVAKQGGFAVLPSLWNALSAMLIFIPGYLLTIPLWFVPVLGLLVPLFWWAWLNSRVMRFDSLVEHATAQERAMISKQYAKQYWLIALAIGALNYIPPLFLLTPVLSALAFGHFSLNVLRSKRLLGLSRG